MGASFRAIRVKRRSEFDGFIEHLTHEAYRAHTHWDVWKALDASFNQYWEDLNQTPGFWELTRRAHQDAVILRLGRLYDPHPTAISLGTLLATMHKHMSAPAPEFPSTLANLDRAQLEAELESVSDSDPSVKKLLTWRNEYLAHRGAQHVARGTFAHLPELGRRDIAKLVNRVVGILRKYRHRLGFPPLSWGRHEETDLKHLLQLLRAGRSAANR
jgi:hypothetical protein